MKPNLDGAHLLPQADAALAPYAQKNSASRGREHTERVDPDRLPFQRDRDRIIHTTAFRRLKGKMQVVSPSEGDHFRNRLTHTLEVAQVARDLARQLHLNEDLAEAIALAHDLGHPPFGHAGEAALDQKMREHGRTFDHNLQSLRVVTLFERRYEDFEGLNLTYEVLEGLQKHRRDFDRGELGKVFFPHLESQLVDISDEIAYLAADLEDGMRGGFFRLEDLADLTICGPALAEVQHLVKDPKIRRATFVRRLMHHLLRHLVLHTELSLQDLHIESLAQVQKLPRHLVAFDPDFYEEFLSLKRWLYQHYYERPSVNAETQRGQGLVAQVFDHLLAHPEKLPTEFMPEADLPQRICDYIAGMTDGYLAGFLD